jgi:hypothetical protein
MGNQTCDLLACSTVPQPTMLLRAPKKLTWFKIIFQVLYRVTKYTTTRNNSCSYTYLDSSGKITVKTLFPLFSPRGFAPLKWEMSVFVREGQPYITENLRKYNKHDIQIYLPNHPPTHPTTYLPIYGSKTLFLGLGHFFSFLIYEYT